MRKRGDSNSEVKFEMSNSKITGNRSPHSHPIDDQQLILSRSSKSTSPSFTSPRFVSPTSSSGTGVVGSSPISVLGKFHHRLPLASIENLKTPPSRSPPGFNTPVKVEEDVIVMDGFLVSSSPSGGRSRSGLDSPGSTTGGLKQSTVLYKKEICRAWENNNNCPNGRRCQRERGFHYVSATMDLHNSSKFIFDDEQCYLIDDNTEWFAHGKEEIRPTRYPTKNKSPSEVCKTSSTVGSCRYVHHGAAVMQEANPSSTITSEREENPTLVSSPQAQLDRPIIKEPAYRPITVQDWSPLDDSIPITKRTNDGEKKCVKSDRELVDAHINDVLYGPNRLIRRLPVLSHICPAD